MARSERPEPEVTRMGFATLHELERDGVRIEVSEIGGRISSLRDSTGREWLVQTGRAEPKFELQDVRFPQGTRGGWDDCLPGIDSEPDPNVQRSGTIADHGDFWFRRWNLIESASDRIVLGVEADDHPLRLQKTISLHADAVELGLRVHNASTDRYALLTSSHPLLTWDSGAVLEVPGVSDAHYFFGERFQPPFDSFEAAIPPGSMSKSYLRWEGIARLRIAGSVLQIEQSTETSPWLGVCINRGLWPVDSPGPDWIALETTTSPCDLLSDAMENDTARVLEPNELVEFATRVTFPAA